MPSPLDSVLAGASDVTSPGPVDASPSPTLPISSPAGATVAPGPDDAAVAAQPLNNNQPTEANPTAEAQPPQQPREPMWKSLLQGALIGLANGGAPGFAAGMVKGAAGELNFQTARAARAQQQQQQQLEQQNIASTIRFRDAEAAHTVLQNKDYQAHLDMLPQEQQQAFYDANQKTVNFLKGMGISFDTSLDHSSDTSATAALQTVHNLYGEVPHVAAFPVAPGLSLVVSGNNLSPDKMLDGLDMLRTINTGVVMTDKERQAFLALPPAAQQKMFSDEANRSKPIPGDPKQMIVYRDQLQNTIANLKQNAGWKKDEIAALQSRLDAVNQALPDATKLVNEFEQRKAQYRARAVASGQDKGDLSDQQIVRGMLDGSLDIAKVASIRSTGGKNRAYYVALAKQADPNFNMQNYQLRLQMNQAYTVGKEGDQISSFNAFVGHSGEALDAVKAYRSSSSPFINKPMNWLAQNAAGDPNYQRLVTALEPVRDEFQAFLEGGHALTESDKKTAQSLLNGEMSPAQIEAAIKQMSSTAIVRLGTINDRYQRVFGKSFPDLLSSDSVNVLNYLGYGSRVADFGHGGRILQPTGQPNASAAPSRSAPSAPAAGSDPFAQFGGKAR